MSRGRERGLRNERAPRDVAGIERHSFGKELRAHRRAQPIGADQEIALRGLTIGEMSNDGAKPRLDPGERLAAVISRGRKRNAQQPIDAVPRGERLRATDFSHDAAVDVVGAAELDRHAEVDRGLYARPSENVPQLRLRHDAGAAPGEFRLHPLEHMGVPAVTRQRERGEQPAHRAADHERASLPLHCRTPAPVFAPVRPHYTLAPNH